MPRISPVLQISVYSLTTSHVPNTTVLTSGWNVITRIVDYILKNQSIVKMVKNPVAAFGGPSIGLLNRVSPLFTAISVAILAAMAIAYTKVKTTYSAKEFKTLLKQKYQFPPNCTVRGDLDLSNCTWLTTLPQGLTVQGDLDLDGCTGLTSLPQGLTVQGNLWLDNCTGLTSLPEKLTVRGSLNLTRCIGLISFPQGLIVRGDLDLAGCTSLISLPQGLTVRGNLLLSGCTSLTSLPQGLTVQGSLNLYGCTGLISLPQGLIVRGNLNLTGCTRLISLPQGLTVQGSLNLYGCTGLTSLPQGLTVQGSLNLYGCTGLTSLPQGLIVRGNLDLTDCTRLTSLPQGLIVRGNLNLTCCTRLTSLPQGLTVQGHLSLTGCTGLTSLPTWITTLGPRADGSTREISLINTGLSEALLTRLRETPAPGIQFYFSNAASSEPAQTFPNLDAALTFWVKETQDENLINPAITIDSAQTLSDILRFLSRLTKTAEYQNLQARPVLAMRVIEVFSRMAESEAIKGRALEIIHDGLTDCDDRIISALENIELMVLLHQIESKSHTETELRALGKRFLLLEMVNAKAEAHKITLTWVDEIEIYLAFQIGLAERLNLPVKTRNMIFRGCAQITDEQINQAGDAVLSECTEGKLNSFLKSWSPWIAHQRKNGPVLAYEDLPAISRKLEKGEVCPFTQEIPEKPVLCGNAVYDYDMLIHCYRTSGINPVDRSAIDLKTLKRVVPSKE